MKPRITVITLGVDDLERACAFYRDGLGLKTDGITGTEFENGAVAFFELEGNLRLALWPRKSLAHDAGLPISAPSATDFSIGHNVGSKKEVDAVMERKNGVRDRFQQKRAASSAADVRGEPARDGRG